MKLKSVLSLLLCFLLCCSPALAQTESDSMQKALSYAKTILTIPEDYTDFAYRAQTAPDGEVSWIFIWSAENKGDVQVYLSDDGYVSAYYSWIYADSYDETLATYTHEEAREIAKAFIEKVNPELYPYLREVTPDGESRDSRTAYFVFQEYCGEIPVFANTVSVTVDKYHGNIRSYQGTRKAEGLPQTTPVLDIDEAKEAYLRDIGLQMEYRMYYNHQDKNYTVFPVYYLKDTMGKAIDAVTGNAIEPYFPDSEYRYGFNSQATDSVMKEESAEGGFSPAELEALSNVGEVYSKEDAIKIANEKIPALEGYALYSASLHRDYRDETKLYWYFGLQKDDGAYADVQMNAKNGQLISFSLPQTDVENTNFTVEDAKAVAKEFLAKEASDVFAMTQYTEDNGYAVPLQDNETLPSSYYLTYRRMQNGIPVSGNALTVRVDANTKQVTYYSRSFTEAISFPDISSCLTPKEILEVMSKNMNFSQVYLPVEEGYRLAYTFQNPLGSIYDPYSGKRLDYKGEPREEFVIPAYTDISGHWGQTMILTLLDNGYYFTENEFRPDDAITKKEFLQFFGMIGNDTDAEVRKTIARIEGIPEGEADANAFMTKEELCYYFIDRLGYQKVAELDEIYKYPFPDEADVSDSLKGDIAILAGFGILKGDANGNFYPQKQLTRAETASAIYHFLKNGQ